MKKSRTYTLAEKIRALDILREHKYQAASAITGIPAATLSRWHSQRDELRREHRQCLQDDAQRQMMELQSRLADKAMALINAMDEERMDKAPLNQIASALGTAIDRYIKLQEQDKPQASEERVIRIEYYDASTGQVSASPPWSEGDSESSGTLQGGRLRQTLRQDGNRQDYHNGKGAAWDADVVAGPDVSDGESGLARFEDDDDERDWYHD